MRKCGMPNGDLKKVTKADIKRVAKAAKKYGTIVRMPKKEREVASMLAQMFGVKG